MRRLPLALVFSAAAAGFITAPADPLHAQAPERLLRFLRDNIGLSGAQVGAVERGESVVKALDTRNTRDVAVFGLVAVDVSRDFYVRRLLDFEHSLKRPTHTQFGLFSTPASPADVQTLTADRKDVADARNCQPGDCDFKLPTVEMQRIQQVIDWSAADPGGQADRYLRQRLVEYVTDYRARGDSAMVVYDDRGSVRGSEAFSALLEQSPYVYQESPAVYRYLTRYPREQLDGAREVFYWSVDALKDLRPILTVNHVVVHAPPEAPFGVAAVKQVYANHYFEAGLDLLAVIDRTRPGNTPGIYLIRLGRFRFDNMPSVPLVNVRGKVVEKFRDEMKIDLEREKATMEGATR
jgi:hypothetical protein